MRNFVVFGAAALVLAFGAAQASASNDTYKSHAAAFYGDQASSTQPAQTSEAPYYSSVKLLSHH
jgi:hypothetical protein